MRLGRRDAENSCGGVEEGDGAGDPVRLVVSSPEVVRGMIGHDGWVGLPGGARDLARPGGRAWGSPGKHGVG